MLTIRTNVPSINTQRTLTKNSMALNQSFQRLSTGLRINSAKDDAAGLAITNRMTSQVRGLNQAVRNANDATSLAQTAEAALNEQADMLQRLRELAVQAASDSYNSTDRQAIQQEADALIAEIDRIATQTSFNNRKLLDGTLSDIKFQVGAFENETVSLTIERARAFDLGSVFSQTTAAVVASIAVDASGVLEFNGASVATIDPSTDRVDNVSSQDNEGSAISKAFAINATTSEHGVTAEINASTATATAAVAATTLSSATINGISIADVTVQANDSDSSLRDAINAVSSETGVEASLTTGNQLVLTAEDGRNIVTANLNTASSLTDGDVHTGTLTLKSDAEVTITGTSGGETIGLTGVTVIDNINAVNVSTLSYITQTGATAAIDTLDDAIRTVSDRQSQLGALLNRMDGAVSQLAAASENISAARSQVRDADFAAETAEFSSNQILQQASSAMLAQANVSNQIALTLLG